MFVNHGLYARAALAEIGFADEETYFFYQGDGDLCLRLADAGHACIDSPDSYIEHYLGTHAELRASNMTSRGGDWRAYAARWGELGEPDSNWIEREFDDPRHTADRYWRATAAPSGAV